MYVQDVALPSSRNRNKKRTDMAPDYSRMKSSHNNDRPGWNDVDTNQTEAVAGEPKNNKIFSSEIAIVSSEVVLF